MKTSTLLFLIGLISLTACKESIEVAPNENIAELREQFTGKYKPIHSTSSEALDVNQDGKASNDMLEEIIDLPQTWVEVLIQDLSQGMAKPSYIFVHQWPKQEFSPAEPTNNSPLIQPIYAKKVVVWEFSFNKEISQLILEPDATYLADPDLFSPLQTVLVKDNEFIEVTLMKRLYTSEGWKTVKIVTLYERFTR